MNDQPFTFAQAADASRAAQKLQRDAEAQLRDITAAAATAEELYRKTLARRIVQAHEQDGIAWSVAPDIARGDQVVAGLRRDRDIAQGQVEAQKHVVWRLTANRRDVLALIEWSARRELAERGPGDQEPAWSQGAAA